MRERGVAQGHHSLDLSGVDHRHDSRNNRDVDVRDLALLVESVEDLVIEEQLRQQNFRARVDLFLEALDLGDHAR